LGKGFDLISGTSTGGIVACALAAGISLEKVDTLYRHHGPAIFPYQRTRALPVLGQLIRGSGVGNRAGDQALQEVLCRTFGTQTIGQMYRERGIALAIPAVDLNRHAAVVFKSPHLQRLNGRDNERTLVDVCLATTAAPILRSMAHLQEPGVNATTAVYVDGGFGPTIPASSA
jgi:patatin-like phospholipase/acyl hydrolase